MRKLLLVATLAIVFVTDPATADPTAYVTGANGEFGIMDLSTGGYTLLGDSSSDLTGLYNTLGGQLLGMDYANQLVQVNPENGALTVIGTGGGGLFTGLANGSLFALPGYNVLDSVNPSTGATTLIGSTGLSNVSSASSFGSDGVHLFLTISVISHDGPDNLYSLNPTTGTATLVGPTGVSCLSGSGVIGGTLYGFDDCNNGIYSLNTTTGAASLVATYSSSLEYINAAVATPEPSSLATMVCAMIAVGLFVRRMPVR
jgi:hypothetical protein